MIRDQIRRLIRQATLAAQSNGNLSDFALPIIEIQRPKQAEHGDYSTNMALVASAAIRKMTGEKSNLREIVQAIVAHLPTNRLISFCQ